MGCSLFGKVTANMMECADIGASTTKIEKAGGEREVV